MRHVEIVAADFGHIMEERRCRLQSLRINAEITYLVKKHGPKVLFELAKMHNSCPELGRRLSK